MVSITPNSRDVNAANLIARLRARDRGLWVTTLTLKRVRLCFKESEREPQPTFYVLTAKAVAIIQVDNGGFHNSLNLSIPENVILLFQPAYSPEVNPIQRLWGYIKEQLKWLRLEQIEELRASLQKELEKLTNEVIASLTGWKFILEALSVARL